MSHQSPARDSTRRCIALSFRQRPQLLTAVSVVPVPTVAWHPQRETIMASRTMCRPIAGTNPRVGRSHGRSHGRICALASTQFHPCALENPTSSSAPSSTQPCPSALRTSHLQRPAQRAAQRVASFSSRSRPKSLSDCMARLCSTVHRL